MDFLFVVKFLFCTCVQTLPIGKIYEPTWESLDTRPAPEWYDQSKFGIFVHWGIYSVPGVESEWFWKHWHDGNPSSVKFMKDYFAPNYTYQHFAADFTARFFDPKKMAKIFKSSGAKYVVVTSKHHDGYTLWNSKYSWNWNSFDIGPHRELLVELAKAVREEGLRFCTYYSLMEWFHPLFLEDIKNRFTTSRFADEHFAYQIRELVERIRPDCIWGDGDWDASSTYWKSKEFLAWLYNESPVKDKVLVNDRWGNDCTCRHGDFRDCQDDFRPDKPPTYKWEDALTLDLKSWGHRKNINFQDVRTVKDFLLIFARALSFGGNILLNVGPSSDGTIDPIFQERLSEIGTWMDRNSEAIFSTKMCIPIVYEIITDQTVYYTCTKDYIYAFASRLTLSDNASQFTLNLKKISPCGSIGADVYVKLLGNSENLEFSDSHDDGLTVQLDLKLFTKIHEWPMFVFRFDGFNFQKIELE